MRLRLVLPLLLVLSPSLFAKDDQIAKETEKDVNLGKEYVEGLEKEITLSTDESLIERVNKIGQALAKIANENHVPATYGDNRHFKFDYVFKVVDDDDVNAFSIPGGFIYVNKGLLSFVESDDELAGVLAHEIAHASHRHLHALVRDRSKADLWTIPIIIGALIKGGEGAGGIVMAGSLMRTALTSGWTQKAETDADRTGFMYLLKSEHHPVALLTFLERLEFRDRFSPKFELGILRTHPPSSERVLLLRKLLAENNIPLERSKVTTSFRAMYEVTENDVVVKFGQRELFKLSGENAETRAQSAIGTLNEFFDNNPQLFDVRVRGNTLYVKRNVVIEFKDTDKTKPNTAMENIKNALFSLMIRTEG